jgi:hypothetical protein
MELVEFGGIIHKNSLSLDDTIHIFTEKGTDENLYIVSDFTKI